jgi:hypothetical protein
METFPAINPANVHVYGTGALSAQSAFMIASAADWLSVNCALRAGAETAGPIVSVEGVVHFTQSSVP